MEKEELYDIFYSVRKNSFIREYNSSLSEIKGINFDIKQKGLEEKIMNYFAALEAHNYYRPKAFENSKIYECLGVRLAKKLVTKIVKKNGKAGNYYLSNERSIDSLIGFEKETRFNEKVHIFSAACILVSPIWQANLANFYLIILQRYNRARVVNTLKRILKERDEFQKLLKY